MGAPAGEGCFAGRSASSVTPITPKITMSWGLSFLCIPCATACADMIVIVNAWVRLDNAAYKIIKRCLAGCLTANNRQGPNAVLRLRNIGLTSQCALTHLECHRSSNRRYPQKQ